MRVVLQRVLKASVTSFEEGGQSAAATAAGAAATADTTETVSTIGRGLVALVGFTHGDKEKDLQPMCERILNLKCFEDENGKGWTKSVKALNLQVLLVSQFTLYSHVSSKKHRPQFDEAMKPEPASQLFTQFVELMQEAHNHQNMNQGKRKGKGKGEGNSGVDGGIQNGSDCNDLVKSGVFGAYMNVSLENDGPVTFILDSTEHKTTSHAQKVVVSQDQEKDQVRGSSPPVNKVNEGNQVHSAEREQGAKNENPIRLSSKSPLPAIFPSLF